MEVFCFHDLKRVSHWAADFERLSLASRRKDPFSTFGFIQNFAAHSEWYPGDKEGRLWFLVAIEAGTPVGYLALRRVVSRVLGVKAAKLTFFVTHDNDCPQLVALLGREAQVSLEFYRYLLGRGSEWSLLEFHQQLPESALTPPPAGLDLGAYYVRTWPTKENNTVELQWPSFEAYFKALGAKHRSDVRRKVRRLLAAGEVSWLSSDDPAATPTLLELVRMIEAHSWKAEHVIALESHPDRLAYFHGLLAKGQPLRIRINVLLVGGVPVCGAICGSYAGTVYGLVTVFDDRASELSPGVVMQMLKLRQAIEGKYRALNLLAGYSYYKAHWLAQPHPTRSGQLFRIGTPWFWKAILGDFRRRVTPPAPEVQVAFNPDRRNASESAPAPLSPSAAERGKTAALIARLDGLPVERLGHAELGRALLVVDAPLGRPAPSLRLMPAALAPAADPHLTGA